MTTAGDVVISIAAVRSDSWDRKDIKKIDGRYRCLVKIQGYLLTVVLCQSKLSPSREYVMVGTFYSDQIRTGWLPVADIELLEVLAKIDEDRPPPKKSWWKRFLLRLANG